MDVRIYTTPTCGYCRQAKDFLSQRGVKFTEYDVSRDRAAADEMVRLTGHTGVPVIVVDGQVVVGFDRRQLEHLLGQGGDGQRPRFGLKVADASKVARRFGAIPVFGALVGEVKPSSPGDRAGLRPGDIITEINMRPVNSAGDLERAFASLTRGSRVNIVFLRADETLRSEVLV